MFPRQGSSYQKMAGPSAISFLRDKSTLKVLFSYVFDWIVLILLGLACLGFEFIEPNKRPFSLNDPNISFPYRERETVPPWLLITLTAAVPVISIAAIALIFVPGATVPKNTPASLIWKRKMWELHVGWLGLALALVSAWFFTQGMKNMFGKPRPDLLSRCEPDIKNAAKFVVGGFSGENSIGQLYSADICQQSDIKKLRDGFRSYPSGHSSSAAGGLIYLTLFIASKFAVTIPFAVSTPGSSGAANYSAFPSRSAQNDTANGADVWDDHATAESDGFGKARSSVHNAKILSVRRQAAGPPIYLLAVTIAPFCVSIFIAASRWWNFRHHGFDILFGYLMGLFCAVVSFRWYHLPMQEGAGWAWGPRSHERAFWAGVGRVGYAEDPEVSTSSTASGHYHAAAFQDNDHPQRSPPINMMHRGASNPLGAAEEGVYEREGPFQDVEMQRIN